MNLEIFQKMSIKYLLQNYYLTFLKSSRDDYFSELYTYNENEHSDIENSFTLEEIKYNFIS